MFFVLDVIGVHRRLILDLVVLDVIGVHRRLILDLDF